MPRTGSAPLLVIAAVMVVTSLEVPAAQAQATAVPGAPRCESRMASARGKEVRVTALDGTKTKGTLLLMAGTEEVVLRRNGKDVQIPLAAVRRVEAVSHHVRSGAMLGLAAGVLSAFVQIRVMNYTDEGLILAPLFDGGIGFGAGIAIGAIVSSRTAAGHVLCTGPTATVRMEPVISRQQVAFRVAFAW